MTDLLVIYWLGVGGFWLAIASLIGIGAYWIHDAWRARRNWRQVAAHIAAQRGFRAAARGGWVREDLQ